MKHNELRRLRRTTSQINIYLHLCTEISLNNFTTSNNETRHIQNHKTFRHAYNKNNERLLFYYLITLFILCLQKPVNQGSAARLTLHNSCKSRRALHKHELLPANPSGLLCRHLKSNVIIKHYWNCKSRSSYV